MPAFRFRTALLSVFSAVLLNLAFPYPGLAFCAWFALVPLFFVVLTEKPGTVFIASLVTGFLFNIVYLLWMKEYKHPASLPGGVFAEMVFFCFAAMLAWVLSSSVRKWKPLALALSWLSVDYIKSIGFLGFPWGILGYSQYGNLPLIQSARVFGVWGVDFLVLYANGLAAFFAAGLATKGFRTEIPSGAGERGFGGLPLALLRAKAVPVAVFAVITALSLVYGTLIVRREDRMWGGRTGGAEAEKRVEAGSAAPEGTGSSRTTAGSSGLKPPGARDAARVALIQANFDPWSPQLAENLRLEMELTRRALEREPDLVVWSESSVPFPYEFHLRRNNRHARNVEEFIRSTGKPFVFGTLEFAGEYRDGDYEGDFYNVAVFYANGKLAGTYRKIHLVPFGEWFPFDRLFPFVDRILQAAGAGDFVPGTEYTVFDAGSFRFNVLICFEDVFGELTRRFVLRNRPPRRPGLIVNVTNDAWTGSRKAQQQHFSISVFRAVENGRSFVRAANGGVTACVNPCGKVLDSLPMFTSGYLVCDVPLAGDDELTLYSRFGDLPVRAAAILAGFALLGALLKKVIDRKKKPRIM